MLTDRSFVLDEISTNDKEQASTWRSTPTLKYHIESLLQ